MKALDRYEELINTPLDQVIMYIKNGKITTDEIGLKITNTDMVLPCGVYGRWENNES